MYWEMIRCKPLINFKQTYCQTCVDFLCPRINFKSSIQIDILQLKQAPWFPIELEHASRYA